MERLAIKKKLSRKYGIQKYCSWSNDISKFQLVANISVQTIANFPGQKFLPSSWNLYHPICRSLFAWGVIFLQGETFWTLQRFYGTLLYPAHYLMGLEPNLKKIPQNSGKQIRIPDGRYFNSLLSIKSQNVDPWRKITKTLFPRWIYYMS